MSCFQDRQRFSSFLCFWTVAVLICAWSQTAMGQEEKKTEQEKPAAEDQDDGFQQLPYDPMLAKLGFKVRKVNNGQMPLEGFEEEYKQYFRDFVFAEWTLPEQRTEIPKLRLKFYRSFLWTTKPPQVRKFLNDHTRRFMIDLIVGEFHPVVQYNAVLTIGRLYAQQPVDRGDEAPIRPDPAATNTLIGAFQSGRTSDLIKAGALRGLKHHIELGPTTIPAEYREKLRRAMLEMVRQEPVEGRDIEVHDWFRRGACEILGAIGQPGGSNEVPQALIVLLSQPDASIAVRCAATEALGDLRYDSKLNIDSDALAKGLARLASDALSDGIRKTSLQGAEMARRTVAYQFQCLDGSTPALAKLLTAEQKETEEAFKATVTATLDVVQTVQDRGQLAAAFGQNRDRIAARLAPVEKTPAAEVEPATKTESGPEKKTGDVLDLDF